MNETSHYINGQTLYTREYVKGLEMQLTELKEENYQLKINNDFGSIAMNSAGVIANLIKQLREANDVISFYADKRSYLQNMGQVITREAPKPNLARDLCDDLVGGKRARGYMQKWMSKEGEE